MRQCKTDCPSKGEPGLKKNLYHCSGCERIISCEQAFRDEAENCDCYVRSSFHRCHKCLNFGGECQKSGLVRCDFTPRIPETRTGNVLARGR